MTHIDRRRFLKHASAASLASATALNGVGANAADTAGYKALVCVFLLGGMDHADTVLPLDTPSYNALATARASLFGSYGVGSGASSRDQANLLPLIPTDISALGGRDYGLPPELAPLHTLFNSGELAVLGGVGPLIEPTTRTTFEDDTARVPLQLFSHNDQQSAWQTFGAEGSTFGWGGRFVDAALASDAGANQRFAAVTAAENAAYLSGETASSFSVSGQGALSLNIVNQRGRLGGGSAYDPVRAAMFDFFAGGDFAARNVFERDFAALQTDALVAGEQFTQDFQNASITTVFPETRLGGQLRAIANTISIRNNLGVSRQVFYASLGGFDTHSDQTTRLPGLHAQIAGAVAAFRDAMIELGVWNDVTLFTATDFGRTTNDNGDGTDHGWGGHHFIAGGSVIGQNVYGALPSSNLDSEEYTASRGRLIPAVSVDQYAATLGSWFGLTEAELNNALPNIGNFAARDLGFMA